MSMRKLVTSTLVTIALTLPITTGAAYAKDGGNSGGHERDGGNHGGNNSGRGKSDNGDSKAPTKGAEHTGNGKKKSDEAKREAKLARADAAERKGLNSLKRNYHAYLNSNDPRFADVFAYVRGYAEYQLANGADTEPTGGAFTDEALREALANAAGTATVSDASLEWAKIVLGVGDDVGKIDQVREALANAEAAN